MSETYTDPKQVVKIWMDRYNMLVARFGKRNQLCREADDLYFGDHWVYEPEPTDTEERITLNIHKQTVDMTVSTFLSAGMKVQVVGPADAPPVRKAADQIEKFLRGVVYANDERSGRSLEHDVCFAATQKARGWIRQLWRDPVPDPQLIPEFPVLLQFIPPENVLYLYGSLGLIWLIMACKRSKSDIEAEFGTDIEWKRMGRKKRWEDKQTMDTDFLDIWYKEGRRVHNLIIAEDILLKPDTDESSRYPDIPYYPFAANPTTAPDPDRDSLSMIWPLRYNVHALEKAFTKHNRITTMYSAIPIIAKTYEPIEIGADAGDVIQLKPDTGESVGYLQWQGSPPDVAYMHNYLSQQIQMDSYPLSMYGNTPAASGYAAQLMGEGGRLRLWPMRRQLERGWSTLFRDTLRLVAMNSNGQGVAVDGQHEGKPFAVNVTAQMIEGMKVYVTFPNKGPMDDLRDRQAAVMLKGLLSNRTLRDRFLGIESPEEEQERVLEDLILTHPAILQAAAQAYAQQNLGIDIRQQQQPNLPGQVMQREPQQPAGLQGPAGRPPLPQEAGAPPNAPLPGGPSGEPAVVPPGS